MKKFIIILLSILVVGAIAFDVWLVIEHKKQPPSLEVKPYTKVYLPYEYPKTTLTKPEIRSLLDNLYKIKYTYEEIEEQEQLTWGYAQGNHIMICDHISATNYVYVLAHEMVHIKYNTNNETFAEYKTITTLVESGNELFRAVATDRAKFIVSGGLNGTERDCGYYLKEYFNW